MAAAANVVQIVTGQRWRCQQCCTVRLGICATTLFVALVSCQFKCLYSALTGSGQLLPAPSSFDGVYSKLCTTNCLPQRPVGKSLSGAGAIFLSAGAAKSPAVGIQRKLFQDSPASEVVDDSRYNEIQLWQKPSLGATAPFRNWFSVSDTQLVAEDWFAYSGQIPNGIEPHPDAVFWKGSRQRIVIQCSASVPVLNISAANVVFSHIQFQGCSSVEYSPTIITADSSAQNVTFVDCVFVGNGSGNGAPAIVVGEDSVLRLQQVLVQNHTLLPGASSRYASAIMTHGRLQMTDCALRYNHADLSGGGVAGSVVVLGGGWLIASGTSFEQNVGGAGAAISLGSAGGAAGANITGCSFASNYCGVGGCGVALQFGSSASITSTTFTGNVAEPSGWARGGAVWATGGADLHLVNCTFMGSFAMNGGAIALSSSSTASAVECSFKNGTAVYQNNDDTGHGGGIFLESGSRFVVSTSIFQYNYGNVGGGIAAVGGSSVEAHSCQVLSNTCSYGGGGAWIRASNLTATDTVFYDNFAWNLWAPRQGGSGVYLVSTAANSSGRLFNCTFTRNRARSASGLHVVGANMSASVINCHFMDNTAIAGGQDPIGGAMAVAAHARVQMEGCRFENNLSEKSAGALFLDESANVTITGTVFHNHRTTSGEGGVIFVQASSYLNLISTNFTSNSAFTDGGALFVHSNAITIATSCLFENNRAGLEGGVANVLFNADLQLYDCTFINNKAGLNGGVVLVADLSFLTVKASRFLNNSADKDGGAINWYRLINESVVENSQFMYNSADRGAALRVGGTGSMIILRNCILSGNYARSTGGGIWLEPFGGFKNRVATRATIYNSKINNNSAPFGGGLHINDRAEAILFDSELTGNIAFVDGGAVLVEFNGKVTMTNVTLEANTAQSYGGAIYLQNNSTAVLGSVTLMSNRATIGGAVSQAAPIGTLSLTSCTLSYNSATLQGGAVQAAALLSIINSTIKHNRAGSEGGALFLLESASLEAQFTNFSDNRASSGGSLYASANAILHHCDLHADAAQRGGSLYVWKGNTTLSSSTVTSSSVPADADGAGGCVFVDSTGSVRMNGIRLADCRGGLGGALMVAGSATLADLPDEAPGPAGRRKALQAAGDELAAGSGISTPCLLERNQALDGGAVYVQGGGSLELTACLMSGNSASSDGGAILAARNSRLHLNRCNVTGNTADDQGGGLLVEGNATLQECRLWANKAKQNGAGLACDKCTSLNVSDLLAYENKAGRKGGAVWVHAGASRATLLDVELRNNSAGQGGGAYLSTLECIQDGGAEEPGSTACINITAFVVESNSALMNSSDTPGSSNGRGGGVYVEARGSVMLENLTVHGNHAQLGGGLFMDTTACEQANGTINGCVQVHQASLSGNRAGEETQQRLQVLGQDMFVTQPEAVQVLCGATGTQGSKSLLQLLTAGSPADDRSCSGSGLKLDSQSTASAAHSLEVIVKWPRTPGVVGSREPLPVQLSVLDMYGRALQLPGADTADFEARISSRSGGNQSAVLLGATLVTGSLNAPVGFSGLQLLADQGHYQLEFSTRRTELKLPPVVLGVEVRQCYAGESKGTLECISCGRSLQFSLALQASNCTHCVSGGNCAFGLLFPQPRFWQSHPRSPQVHACLYEGACMYHNRQGVLLGFQESHRNLSSRPPGGISSKDVDWYQNAQCDAAHGYTGALCATCREGYGRNGPFCAPCLGRARAALALATVVLAQALIIATQMVVYHLSIRRIIEYASTVKRAIRSVQFSAATAVRGSGRDAAAQLPSAQSGIARMGTLGQRLSHTLGSFNLSSVPGDDDDDDSPDPPGLPVEALAMEGLESAGPSADLQLVAAEAQQQELIELATGSLKVLLEFVQLLGIVRSVRLPMPVSVRNFLNVVDVTSASSGQLLYCSLWGSPAARVGGTVLFATLLPPVFILAAPALLMLSSLAWGLWSRRYSPLTQHELYHHSTIATVFILLFFFPTVCRQLLLLFSFISLDRPEQEQPEGTVLGFQGTFWLQVPDIKYNTGAHHGLLLGLGIPGLAWYGVVLPLVLAGLLYRHRRRLHRMAIRSRFGMLYSDFSPECYYWQSVVLMAQMLLIVCAVLLASVGTAVQLLSALAVVMSYQFLTSVMQPYKHHKVLVLARTTLLSVGFTLVLLLFLVEARKESSQTVLIVLLLLVNTGVVALVLGYIAMLLWRVQSVQAQLRKIKSATIQLTSTEQGGTENADEAMQLPPGGEQHLPFGVSSQSLREHSKRYALEMGQMTAPGSGRVSEVPSAAYDPPTSPAADQHTQAAPGRTSMKDTATAAVRDVEVVIDAQPFLPRSAALRHKKDDESAED